VAPGEREVADGGGNTLLPNAGRPKKKLQGVRGKLGAPHYSGAEACGHQEKSPGGESLQQAVDTTGSHGRPLITSRGGARCKKSGNAANAKEGEGDQRNLKSARRLGKQV